MELELRHLKVVCAIADAGSVTKAASMLGLPQPALTTQLQRIERVFGAELFVRDQKGARPTPLGDLVLARARVLLPVVHDLRDEAARLAAQDPTTHYRLGAVHGPILPGVVSRFTADRPQDRLTIHADWSVPDLAEQVNAGRLDFAIVGVCGGSLPPEGSGLVWREIAVDPVFVLVESTHPVAGKEAVELSEFADRAWTAGRGDGGCFDDCFAMACAKAGFTPATLYEADPLAALELVESGVAVGLSQGGFERRHEVVPVPLVGNPIRWHHLLIWHPERATASCADQFVEYARASYTSAVERSHRYHEWLDEHPEFGVTQHSRT